MTLADEAAILLPYDPQTAARIFKEVLEEIARVKYYRPKSPRPSQPRVTKKPANKWCKRKGKKSRGSSCRSGSCGDDHAAYRCNSTGNTQTMQHVQELRKNPSKDLFDIKSRAAWEEDTGGPISEIAAEKACFTINNHTPAPLSGDPNGNRTRVFGVRGRCPDR